MSEPANPDRMERFVGGALMAVGAMLFFLCGLCTLGFASAALLNATRYPGTATGIATGLLVVGVVGGLPTLGGFMLMRIGWRLNRRPTAHPAKDAGAPQ